MYWQVYLHKTVLSAEMLLVKIITRAKELIRKKEKVAAATAAFDLFLQQDSPSIEQNLATFCRLDDNDVMTTIKNWGTHPDKILSLLCRSLTDRRLYKVKLQSTPVDEELLKAKSEEVKQALQISDDEVRYFVFTGIASNTTYDPADERINILFKDGTVKDISKVDNAVIQPGVSSTVKKYYICHYRV
jgi:HD superfamily phosphohydrolase